MTRKVYKSAMGKTVDIGALMLQNEQVRAVGNMNVNARGDVLDSNNRVIDQKNRQIQRQNRRQQTNVSTTPVTEKPKTVVQDELQMLDPQDTFEDLDREDQSELQASTPVADPAPLTTTGGGLAAAIARSRAVKQELEKTPRQLAQQSQLKKI